MCRSLIFRSCYATKIITYIMKKKNSVEINYVNKSELYKHVELVIICYKYVYTLTRSLTYFFPFFI